MGHQLFINFRLAAMKDIDEGKVTGLICTPPCETNLKYRDVDGPGRYGQTRTRRAGTLKSLDVEDLKGIRAASCMRERAAGLSCEVKARVAMLFTYSRSRPPVLTRSP